MKVSLIYSRLVIWITIAFFAAATESMADVQTANIAYGRPNIAIGGTIVSSSPAVRGSAEYINDGLLGTLMYSYIRNQNDGRYYCEFVLDLHQSYTIDEIDLYIAQTRGFTLSISDDNVNWTELHTREWAGSISAPVKIALTQSVSGRYLKYYGWASWNQYVGVVEISVYEKGSAAPASPQGAACTVNIAKNKPVTLSVGGAEPDHPLENVVDGNLQTSWIVKDKGRDDETGKNLYAGGMVLDLEKETTLGKIVVNTKKYHTVVISFPEKISDFWGKEWSFYSLPDLFASDITGSGKVVFDLKGLISARYITLYIETLQVTSEQPEITELEVYEYTNTFNPAVIMYLLQ